MARTSAPLSIKLTPQQEEALRALAVKRGVNVSAALRDLLAQASPDFREAPTPRKHVPVRPQSTHLEVLDLDGNPILATREEADRLADLRREFGLNVPAGPERARRAAEAKRALAARGEAIVAGTKPPPSPGTKPRPVRRESEREELNRLRAEAYAQLSDVERAEAAKIKDPAARTRFVVARLQRRERLRAEAARKAAKR